MPGLRTAQFASQGWSAYWRSVNLICVGASACPNALASPANTSRAAGMAKNKMIGKIILFSPFFSRFTTIFIFPHQNEKVKPFCQRVPLTLMQYAK